MVAGSTGQFPLRKPLRPGEDAGDPGVAAGAWLPACRGSRVSPALGERRNSDHGVNVTFTLFPPMTSVFVALLP